MSSQKIAVVDTGVGNLRSVIWGLQAAGATAELTSDPDLVRKASAVVIPGQGAFGPCMRALCDKGLASAVKEVIQADKPYLGICLGMQILFEGSEESPDEPGLGTLAGVVRKFPNRLTEAQSGERLKVPQIGWNEIQSRHAFLPTRGWFYFVHSYYCDPVQASIQVAHADYGVRFCAAVAQGSLFACQFHPEKSQTEGQNLLQRFVSSVYR